MGSANSQQVVRRRMEILFMLSPLYKSTRQIFESLISKGFEIPDIRLVQIDLKELRNDFPLNIEYRKDQNGVFQYKLPSHNSENKRKNSSMSPREAICFQIAFQHLSPLLPNKSLDDLDPYLNEAEAVLNDSSSKKMKNWKDKVMTINEGLQLKQAVIKKNVLSKIHKALWDEKVIEASYTSKNKAYPSNYVIHPAGLVYRGRICYLICSFENNNEKVIYLPLHRFTSVKVIEESYSRHRKQKVQMLAKDLLGYKLKDQKINVELKFTNFAGAHLFETPLSKHQKAKVTKDQYIIIKDRVTDNMELRYWIRAFGDSVEVLKPIKLRKEFADESKRTMKKYEKN